MYSICIADDEKYVLKSITQRISSSGMELEVVGMAGNGLEALELYDREQPDIFFVDINMPVVNGLDFIERIRKKDPDVRTRFIIISGYDDFAYMKKAIQLGVINYIKKPIRQQEFTDMLRDVCRQLDEEREKEEKKEGDDPDLLQQGKEALVVGRLLHGGEAEEARHLPQDAEDQDPLGESPAQDAHVPQGGHHKADGNQGEDQGLGEPHAQKAREKPGAEEHAHHVKGVEDEVAALQLAEEVEVHL